MLQGYIRTRRDSINYKSFVLVKIYIILCLHNQQIESPKYIFFQQGKLYLIFLSSGAQDWRGDMYSSSWLNLVYREVTVYVRNRKRIVV